MVPRWSVLAARSTRRGTPRPAKSGAGTRHLLHFILCQIKPFRLKHLQEQVRANFETVPENEAGR
jgi:hypothetical protein